MGNDEGCQGFSVTNPSQSNLQSRPEFEKNNPMNTDNTSPSCTTATPTTSANSVVKPSTKTPPSFDPPASKYTIPTNEVKGSWTSLLLKYWQGICSAVRTMIQWLIPDPESAAIPTTSSASGGCSEFLKYLGSKGAAVGKAFISSFHNYYNGASIVTGFLFELLTSVFDYLAKNNEKYESLNMSGYYICGVLSVLMIWMGVFNQVREGGNAAFGYQGDHFFPWVFQASHPYKPKGTSATMFSCVAGIIQLIVLIWRALAGYDKWIPPIMIVLPGISVLAELLALLRYKLKERGRSLAVGSRNVA